MSVYDISRWDAFNFGGDVHPKPIFYLKPDETLLDFINANNGAVIVEVEGTGGIYDGKKIAALVSSVEGQPLNLPNLYKKTGLYVFQLHAEWHGYPQHDRLGTIRVYGPNSTKDSEEVVEADGVVANSKMFTPSNVVTVNTSLGPPYSVLILLIIFLVLFLVVVKSCQSKNV